MNEHWDKIVTECILLSEATGIPVPDLMTGEAGTIEKVGRQYADIWMREASMLQALAGFLGKVNRKLEKATAKREEKSSP